MEFSPPMYPVSPFSIPFAICHDHGEDLNEFMLPKHGTVLAVAIWMWHAMKQLPLVRIQTLHENNRSLVHKYFLTRRPQLLAQ